MLPFTAVAVMQLVERGELSLDDDIAKYIPEFPTQGHHVTIRQLISDTSGIVDYHYRGDPLESSVRQPKAMDEVIALFANGQWVHEPGTQWDWSISNVQLLDEIIERVSGEPFADYMQQNLFAPAGAVATTMCDNSSVIHGLSHAYQERGRPLRGRDRRQRRGQHRSSLLQHGFRSLPYLARRSAGQDF